MPGVWLELCCSRSIWAAGESFHAGTSGASRRGSLQLWGAGKWAWGADSLTQGTLWLLVSWPSPSSQLMHPVLESLRNTDRQWLIDTLYAFNSGNVERFQTLKTAWGQQVSHRRGWWSSSMCPLSVECLPSTRHCALIEQGVRSLIGCCGTSVTVAVLRATSRESFPCVGWRGCDWKLPQRRTALCVTLGMSRN